MKIIVNPHKLEIAKEPVNEREIDITKCEFEFADEITNDYVKEAYFTFDGTTYKQIIVNNECSIPYEVLEKKGQVEIGVVAFKTEGAEEIKRYNPSPAYFNTWVGSLKDNAENSEPITPTDKEQIESAIANIQAEQVTQNEDISQNTSDIGSLREGKQDKLISGRNIKTINNESLLGAGNLEVITDLSDYYTKGQTDDLLDDKADRSEIPDVSEFITKDVDNLTNYTKTNDMNTAINTAVGNERTSRESSDVALQNQIDAITASSDVVDVVSTYQDLLNYRTASLTEDDIIKVMQDESHSNAISYFRWQLSTWVYIGSEGPFYTKGETDTLLNNKANVSDLPDLTNYVKNTDYASYNKGGVIKLSNTYATTISEYGTLNCLNKTYSDYGSLSNGAFISKGTLENVITGKHLVNQSTLETSQAEQDNTIEGLQAELERYKLLENALPHTENETASDYVTLENTAKSPMEVSLTPQTSQETTLGTNYFNANAIPSSTGIVVSNDGKTMEMPIATSGNGYTLVGVFRDLCPTIKAGDILYLYFERNLGSMNKIVLLHGSNYVWRITEPHEITQEELDGKIALYANRYTDGETNQCILTDFRMVKTQNEPWEKFTYGASPNPDYPQEIHRTTGENQIDVTGKNLLDRTQCEEDKILTWNAGIVTSNTDSLASGFILVNANDKIISTYKSQVMFYQKDKTYIGCLQTDGTAIAKTSGDYFSAFTIPNESSIKYIRLGFRSSVNNHANMKTANIMVNKGTTLLDYVPYESTTYPISLGTKEMFNINGVYDGFVYDESVDKFYINRNIGKVILNGSESGWVNTYGANLFSIADFLNNYPFIVGYGLSNYYRYNPVQSGIDAATSHGEFALQADIHAESHYNIFFKNTDISSVDNWKSWLSTHNTSIIYQLLNSTLEEITDTTLISQLRAIKNALSMQGTTHIISTSSGTNLPFLIKARAVQNISNS